MLEASLCEKCVWQNVFDIGVADFEMWNFLSR
jgi:hypothetical protein